MKHTIMGACLVFSIMVALGVAECAQACSCAPSPPPLKALAGVGAVFSGKVTRLERTARGFTVTLKAAKSWKGGVSGTVLVNTGSGMGDCGFEFRQGQSYLIYAYRGSEGPWRTDGCTRTALLRSAANDILEFEGRLPPLTSPERPPILELKGRLKDSGSNDHIFKFQNRLNERIFYISDAMQGCRVQIFSSGHWLDYIQPYAAEKGIAPTPAAAAAAWKKLKRNYDELPPESLAEYVDRAGSRLTIVEAPKINATWRVGYQYLTEREFDFGVRLQNSNHYIWSAPINPATPLRSLSYNQAFAP